MLKALAHVTVGPVRSAPRVVDRAIPFRVNPLATLDFLSTGAEVASSSTTTTNNSILRSIVELTLVTLFYFFSVAVDATLLYFSAAAVSCTPPVS